MPQPLALELSGLDLQAQCEEPSLSYLTLSESRKFDSRQQQCKHLFEFVFYPNVIVKNILQPLLLSTTICSLSQFFLCS